MPAPDPARQRAARDKLNELIAHPSRVFVIHYACQSLEANASRGPGRVTAIAIRHLARGDTIVFSVHLEAELKRLAPVQILSRLDELERGMLAKFFAFLASNRSMRFVHWNMRDATFGFAAIESRFRMLGLESFQLPEPQKLDLARLLVDIYGSGYSGRPPIKWLAERNGLDLYGYLEASVEAEAFERGNYALVQRSAVAKVRLKSDILYLAQARRLKTRATWWTLNRGRIREAVEMFESHPVRAVFTLGFAGMSAGFLAVWQLF